MKNVKNKMGLRIAIVAISVCIIIFGILNITWFAFVHNVYQPFMDAVGCNEYGEYTVIGEDNYRYSVFKPTYLSFTSNLSIGENKALNESEEMPCRLLIWPKFFGGYEYGVSFSVLVDDAENDEELAFRTYGFMLDENMNPLEELEDEELKIIEENKDTIELLYEKAYKMWGIGG